MAGVLWWHNWDNPWLWATLAAALWHQAEHTHILSPYLGAFSAPGRPGLLADGGGIGGGTGVSRPDLHFVYNIVETVPMALALVYARRQRPTSGESRLHRGANHPTFACATPRQ
ncbi:MAG: hypothetical protein ACRD0G_17500 [Acidimicrobiales bacterium]